MKSTFDRFIDKVWVDQGETNCWPWTGCLKPQPDGYGQFWASGRLWAAHVWSYKHHCGPIPRGLELDHICRNRRCVNPAHLEPVTRRENLLRGIGIASINAGKTACCRGHPFTSDNTYFDKNGRSCRECRRIGYRRWVDNNRDRRRELDRNHYARKTGR